MKKLSTIIAIVMLAATLMGCDSDTELQKPSEVTVNNEQASINSTESTDDSTKEEVTITEAVLLDEAGVKITAKSFSEDSLFGPEVKLLIENNSGKNLTFQARNTSVNGFMTANTMSVNVVNGKKANDSLTLFKSSLEDAGIEKVSDIELSFYIFDSDEWDEYLSTPQIQIKTSAYGNYVHSFDDSGDVVLDDNGIKIVIKGLNNDDLLGQSIVVYVENNTGRNITVQNDNVSVNGFMVNSIYSCNVVDTKRAIDSITFLSTELEENEITDIESVELSFHIFDSDSWDTILDTETVTINF